VRFARPPPDSAAFKEAYFVMAMGEIAVNGDMGMTLVAGRSSLFARCCAV
jgi:hypothetical protein